MFDHLTPIVDIPGHGLESLEPQPVSEQGPPPLPPTRFGALRVVIDPDPNRPQITITASVRDTGVCDYCVFVHREILSTPSYYAELIVLLRTVSAASTVTIYISSPGGSLLGGAQIAAAIQACRAPVTTVVVGIAASAAALVWSYGARRQMAPGSVLMFHMSSHMGWGNSEEIRLTAEYIVRYVKVTCVDLLLRDGLLTLDEAETIIDKRRDLWLDATTMMARLETRDGQST